MDNNAINIRLQKYRKTQLYDKDINEIREDILAQEQEKIRDKKIKELDNQIRSLKEEHHKDFWNYMHNIQGPFLKIEKIIVKEHCHEYPEYMELKKKEQEYIESEKAFENKISKLNSKIYLL